MQSTLIMNQKHQEDLAHIRSMMERSSRFISLSGLSGVFAGLSALIGGIYVYQLFKANGMDYLTGYLPLRDFYYNIILIETEFLNNDNALWVFRQL